MISRAKSSRRPISLRHVDNPNSSSLTILVGVAILLGLFTKMWLFERLSAEFLVSGTEAPVRVEVIGSSALMARIDRCKLHPDFLVPPNHNGMDVRWDDTNSYSPEAPGTDCSNDQTVHSYAVPGTYNISLIVWGPSTEPYKCGECMSVAYEAKTTIVVTGTKPADKIDIQSATFARDDSNALVIKWFASVAEKSVISTTAVADDGTIIGERRNEKWAAVAAGGTWLHLDHNRNDVRTFRVRAQIERDGNLISETWSPPIPYPTRDTSSR